MVAPPHSLPTADLSQGPVELLQTLISFDTTNPPGNEKDCIEYLRALLDLAGFESVTLGRSPDRPNLVTRLEGRGEAPPLLLHGHVDVVPAGGGDWVHPPFGGRQVDGYLWGRGALDMKGGIVMMLSALLRLKREKIFPPGDVVLALVSDEEAGGEFGTKYLVENHKELFAGIRYAVGEFGGFSFPIARRRFYPIMVAEKQICVLRATIRGAAGHGSLRPRDGATAKLARVLGRLERRPLPVHVTPVAKEMFQSVSSSLSFPLSGLFRLLLRPATTGLALKAMGVPGIAVRATAAQHRQSDHVAGRRPNKRRAQRNLVGARWTDTARLYTGRFDVRGRSRRWRGHRIGGGTPRPRTVESGYGAVRDLGGSFAPRRPRGHSGPYVAARRHGREVSCQAGNSELRVPAYVITAGFQLFSDYPRPQRTNSNPSVVLRLRGYVPTASTLRLGPVVPAASTNSCAGF